MAAAPLRHLSFTAHDLGRARVFYEAVMGWRFTPWVQPDVLQIEGPGLGALVHTPVTVAGRDLLPLEPTFAIDDVDATAAAITAGGGRILQPAYHLVGIGVVIRFEDPDGHILCAMAYENETPPTLVEGAARMRHFAINAEDVAVSRAFYERVFGWTFTPWGPPGFYQTRSVGTGVMGALQGRRDISGRRMPGFEFTFAVDDVQAAGRAIEAAGGRVLMPPFHIEGVGHLIFFEDTEGAVSGAMQYEGVQWPE